VACLGELYPGICVTAEERAWKNLSQGSRRVPVETMKTEYTAHNIQHRTYINITIKIHTYRIKQNHTKHTTKYTMIKKEPVEHEGIG